MSQPAVERVIGVLVTDEGLRRRFGIAPHDVLQEMRQRGMELNPCEMRSLLALDAEALSRFADAIDPRLQKTEIEGGSR